VCVDERGALQLAQRVGELQVFVGRCGVVARAREHVAEQIAESSDHAVAALGIGRRQARQCVERRQEQPWLELQPEQLQACPRHLGAQPRALERPIAIPRREVAHVGEGDDREVGEEIPDAPA